MGYQSLYQGLCYNYFLHSLRLIINYIEVRFTVQLCEKEINLQKPLYTSLSALTT